MILYSPLLKISVLLGKIVKFSNLVITLLSAPDRAIFHAKTIGF
jgi:hypothetical protein